MTVTAFLQYCTGNDNLKLELENYENIKSINMVKLLVVMGLLSMRSPISACLVINTHSISYQAMSPKFSNLSQAYLELSPRVLYYQIVVWTRVPSGIFEGSVL